MRKIVIESEHIDESDCLVLLGMICCTCTKCSECPLDDGPESCRNACWLSEHIDKIIIYIE